MLEKLKRIVPGRRKNLDPGSVVIAPIDSLPEEILSQIFLLACSRPSAVQIYDNGALANNNTPTSPAIVCILQVCKHWKALAINTPTLWTNTPIPLNIARITNEAKLKGFETWLRRSEGSRTGFAITIWSQAGDASGRRLGCRRRILEETMQRGVLSLLSTSFPRCHTLTVFVSPFLPVQLLFLLLVMDFPALTSLSLLEDDLPDDVAFNIPIPLRSHPALGPLVFNPARLPHLKEFLIRTPNLQFLIGSSEAYASLDTLSISYFMNPSHLLLLTRCPRLRVLDVFVRVPGSGSGFGYRDGRRRYNGSLGLDALLPDDGEIRHGQLKELRFIVQSGAAGTGQATIRQVYAIACVLGILTLPNLRELTIVSESESASGSLASWMLVDESEEAKLALTHALTAFVQRRSESVGVGHVGQTSTHNLKLSFGPGFDAFTI